MIKIAITGHRPDAFLVSHYSDEWVKHIIENIISAFYREHKSDLHFNLGGAIGVDQWVGDFCIENKIPFSLYLPFKPEVQSRYWSQEQKDNLSNQVNHASGLTIIEPMVYNISAYNKRNEKMIDDSDFVVAFWVGKRSGGTFNAIKYALKNSKFVLNAFDELKPIFTENLKNGWTPPEIK